MVGTFCPKYWTESPLSRRKSLYFCDWEIFRLMKTFKQICKKKKIEFSGSCHFSDGKSQEKHLCSSWWVAALFCYCLWCRQPALLDWLFVSRRNHWHGDITSVCVYACCLVQIIMTVTELHIPTQHYRSLLLPLPASRAGRPKGTSSIRRIFKSPLCTKWILQTIVYLTEKKNICS